MPLHAQAPRLLSASSLRRRPRFRSSSSAAINHSIARPTSPTRRNSFSASPRGRSNAVPRPRFLPRVLSSNDRSSASLAHGRHVRGDRMKIDTFATLNEAQRRAAVHRALDANPAPLLIIAGAGSGKTNTLAHRVAYLVREGADPNRLLLLTFSRRAAMELERRAGRVLRTLVDAGGGQLVALPWAGTFHSIGARLLREYAERVGLPANFTIHDRGDSEDLMAVVRQDLKIAVTKKRFPGSATCVAIYSRSVNAESPLTDVLRDNYPWCAAWESELNALFATYVAAKQSQQILDFDDLLLYWAGMLADGALARELGDRFDHVLVDEYQDTNRLQSSILLLLKPNGRGVTVVGDDAQAIYGFRAATVRNILDFPHQ